MLTWLEDFDNDLSIIFGIISFVDFRVFSSSEWFYYFEVFKSALVKLDQISIFLPPFRLVVLVIKVLLTLFYAHVLVRDSFLHHFE